MSEKDQEQFMKHTPVEGAPQFDVAAPAFVPKEEAEDLVVPEASGLSVTETEAMKEDPWDFSWDSYRWCQWLFDWSC